MNAQALYIYRVWAGAFKDRAEGAPWIITHYCLSLSHSFPSYLFAFLCFPVRSPAAVAADGAAAPCPAQRSSGSTRSCCCCCHCCRCAAGGDTGAARHAAPRPLLKGLHNAAVSRVVGLRDVPIGDSIDVCESLLVAQCALCWYNSEKRCKKPQTIRKDIFQLVN